MKREILKRELFEAQGGRCFYCMCQVDLHPAPWGIGNPTPSNFATIEHLVRRADGGSNDRANVVIACFECNSERGAIAWEEWLEIRRLFAFGQMLENAAQTTDSSTLLDR